MKKLKRIRYYTANPWNNVTAPAYNLKVYNVVDEKLRNKVFDVLQCDEYWDKVNVLINEFDASTNYQWQAGFNGASGGYLVLYKGGIHDNGRIYIYPGKGIDEKEVPHEVLKNFRKLATNIVRLAEYYAKKYNIVDEEYTVVKTRKTLRKIK